MRRATRRTQPYRGMKFGSSQGPPGPTRDAMRLGRAMSMPNPMDSRRALAKGKGLGAKMGAGGLKRSSTDPPGLIPGYGDVREGTRARNLADEVAQYDAVKRPRKRFGPPLNPRQGPPRPARRRRIRARRRVSYD